MRFSTQMRIRDQMVERISRVFREANNYRFHADEITAKVVKQIYEDEEYKRLPQYQQWYLRGFREALWFQLWHSMSWVFPWYGQIYDNWTDLPDDAREFYKQPHNAGFHVYRTARDKCFTGSQEAFDLLYTGGVDRVEQAGEINKEMEVAREAR